MAQLLIVVMSIALLAIVVVGGANYMNTDLGVRSETVRQVAVSRNAIEGAMASYRIANRGALPSPESPSGDSAWKSALDGYVVQGAFNAPAGMAWRFVQDEDGKFLCLEAGVDAGLSSGVVSGLVHASKADPTIVLSDSCEGGAHTADAFAKGDAVSRPSLKITMQIAE